MKPIYVVTILIMYLLIGITYGQDHNLDRKVDSLQLKTQLDELRTQYEVNRYIIERQNARKNLIFAVIVSVLLATVLGVRIYYRRKIMQKDRALAQKIKELIIQKELHDAELLNKTISPKEIGSKKKRTDNDTFCPESRKDKLCIAIRDIILKENAYRNPAFSREYVIERLGVSRNMFADTFYSCYSMPFTEYINSLRMKDAIKLLEKSDCSIEEISIKTGFGTIRTFQRQFQKSYNLSPKSYRDSMRRENP